MKQLTKTKFFADLQYCSRGFEKFYEKLKCLETTLCNYENSYTFPGIMWGPTKNKYIYINIERERKRDYTKLMDAESILWAHSFLIS